MPTLLRMGVSDSVELRVETDGPLRAQTGDAVAYGFADTSLGLKWHLLDAGGGRDSDNGWRFADGLFGVVLGKDFSERLHGFVELSVPQVAECMAEVTHPEAPPAR